MARGMEAQSKRVSDDDKGRFILWQKRVKYLLIHCWLAELLNVKESKPRNMSDENWSVVWGRREGPSSYLASGGFIW